MAKKLPFELRSHEEILKKESGIYLKSKLNAKPGTLYLTTERIVFFQNKLFMLFGLLGLLLDKFINIGKAIEIELKDIGQFERTKYGLNKNVLDLMLKDGTVHRVTFTSDYESWEKELKMRCK